MAQKVKVRVCKKHKVVKKNDIELARNIVMHMRKVLPKQYDYIINSAPEVRFWMHDDGYMLESILFESECEDSIFVDEENVCLCLSDVDKYDTLFEHEGFGDIFRMRPNNIYALEPDVQEALIERRKYHIEMCGHI